MDTKIRGFLNNWGTWEKSNFNLMGCALIKNVMCPCCLQLTFLFLLYLQPQGPVKKAN